MNYKYILKEESLNNYRENIGDYKYFSDFNNKSELFSDFENKSELFSDFDIKSESFFNLENPNDNTITNKEFNKGNYRNGILGISEINSNPEALTYENNNLSENSYNKDDNINKENSIFYLNSKENVNFIEENLGFNEDNTAEKTDKKKSKDNKPEIKESNVSPEITKNEPKIEIEIKKTEEEKKNILPTPPKQYEFDDIKNILSILPKNNHNEIIQSFIYTDNLKELENKMSDKTYFAPKKRNRNKEEKKSEAKKPGRKKKEDTSDRDHSKDSEDNIIKKIKNKFITTLVIFINCIINSSLSDEKIKSYVRIMKNLNDEQEPEKEDLIKYLDNKKTVEETKKEINLNFLKMPLKEFLSIDISPKYTTYERESNKIMINEIIKNEKENEVLMFILNDLTFEDYMDVYTRKKKFSDFKQLDLNKIYLIERNFTYVDSLLEEVYRKNDKDNYFSRFTSILYNFKRWFFIKQDRKREKKAQNF